MESTAEKTSIGGQETTASRNIQTLASTAIYYALMKKTICKASLGIKASDDETMPQIIEELEKQGYHVEVEPIEREINYRASGETRYYTLREETTPDSPASDQS